MASLIGLASWRPRCVLDGIGDLIDLCRQVIWPSLVGEIRSTVLVPETSFIRPPASVGLGPNPM
jgi:hypothetical protein